MPRKKNSSGKNDGNKLMESKMVAINNDIILRRDILELHKKYIFNSFKIFLDSLVKFCQSSGSLYPEINRYYEMNERFLKIENVGDAGEYLNEYEGFLLYFNKFKSGCGFEAARGAGGEREVYIRGVEEAFDFLNNAGNVDDYEGLIEYSMFVVGLSVGQFKINANEILNLKAEHDSLASGANGVSDGRGRERLVNLKKNIALKMQQKNTMGKQSGVEKMVEVERALKESKSQASPVVNFEEGRSRLEEEKKLKNEISGMKENIRNVMNDVEELKSSKYFSSNKKMQARVEAKKNSLEGLNSSLSAAEDNLLAFQKRGECGGSKVQNLKNDLPPSGGGDAIKKLQLTVPSPDDGHDLMFEFDGGSILPEGDLTECVNSKGGSGICTNIQEKDDLTQDCQVSAVQEVGVRILDVDAVD